MHMEVFETPNSFLALNRGEKRADYPLLYPWHGFVLFYFF